MMSIQKKISITIIILIAILAISFFLLITPCLNSIKFIKKTVKSEEQKIKSKQINGLSTEKKQELIAKYEKETELFSQIILTNKSSLELIYALEKIAQDLEIEQEMNFSKYFINTSNKKTSQEQYQTLPLILSLNTDYPNFLNYLLALEKLPFYSDIQKINLTKIMPPKNQIDIQEFQDKIQAEIKIYTYWKKE